MGSGKGEGMTRWGRDAGTGHLLSSFASPLTPAQHPPLLQPLLRTSRSFTQGPLHSTEDADPLLLAPLLKLQQDSHTRSQKCGEPTPLGPPRPVGTRSQQVNVSPSAPWVYSSEMCFLSLLRRFQQGGTPIPHAKG